MLQGEKPLHWQQAIAWHGDIPTYNVYTFGICGEKFFQELKKNGRLLGTRCPECEITYIPPRRYCERCFAHLQEWQEVPTWGRVFAYTLAYYDLDGRRLEEPDILALVRFDGVHGGLIHRLGEVGSSEVYKDMEVEALLKPEGQRQGSILDILYFRPRRKGG